MHLLQMIRSVSLKVEPDDDDVTVSSKNVPVAENLNIGKCKPSKSHLTAILSRQKSGRKSASICQSDEWRKTKQFYNPRYVFYDEPSNSKLYSYKDAERSRKSKESALRQSQKSVLQDSDNPTVTHTIPRPNNSINLEKRPGSAVILTKRSEKNVGSDANIDRKTQVNVVLPQSRNTPVERPTSSSNARPSSSNHFDYPQFGMYHQVGSARGVGQQKIIKIKMINVSDMFKNEAYARRRQSSYVEEDNSTDDNKVVFERMVYGSGKECEQYVWKSNTNQLNYPLQYRKKKPSRKFTVLELREKQAEHETFSKGIVLLEAKKLKKTTVECTQYSYELPRPKPCLTLQMPKVDLDLEEESNPNGRSNHNKQIYQERQNSAL